MSQSTHRCLLYLKSLELVALRGTCLNNASERLAVDTYLLD